MNRGKRGYSGVREYDNSIKFSLVSGDYTTAHVRRRTERFLFVFTMISRLLCGQFFGFRPARGTRCTNQFGIDPLFRFPRRSGR